MIRAPVQRKKLIHDPPQRIPTKSFSACWHMRASQVRSIESPDSSASARTVASSIDAEELSPAPIGTSPQISKFAPASANPAFSSLRGDSN
jgi:hypothetical protein